MGYDLQRVMGAHQPTKHTSQLPQHERSHRRVNDRSTATCQRQEYSNLLTTGAQQPQARNRQCAGVQRVPSTNVLGISPPSSKGDGWGVGRGRQVFVHDLPLSTATTLRPPSIFHYQTIQRI